MAPKLKQLFYHNKQTAGGGRVGLSLKTAPPPFEECPSAGARESETSYMRCTLSTPRGSRRMPAFVGSHPPWDGRTFHRTNNSQWASWLENMLALECHARDPASGCLEQWRRPVHVGRPFLWQYMPARTFRLA